MPTAVAPKTTCLINTFNYAQYLGEAVDGALQQTVPFDEIVVVDDGSTDDSLDLLARRYGGNERVRVIAKSNAGQLSCFNEGFQAARGDVVCFLDADDLYEPNYLEELLKVYEQRPTCDFVLSGYRLTGQAEGEVLLSPRDLDLGYSVVLALCLSKWIGSPTSCLSARRPVLEKVLPLPYAEDWKTSADDCLLYGSSVAGARKCFLAQPLVRYRIHGRNLFYGKPADPGTSYRFRLAINRIGRWLIDRLGYDAARLAELAPWEFATLAEPSFKRLRNYSAIVLQSRLGPLRKLRAIAGMTIQYLRGRKFKREDTGEFTTETRRTRRRRMKDEG
jgi:glycosyltransferase involved in cell wall biosynthesis